MAERSSERVLSLRFAASMSVSKLRKRGFIRERVAEGMFCFSRRIMSSFGIVSMTREMNAKAA